MNFRGDEGKYLGLPGNDDGFLCDLMRAAADAGGMVDPHGENIEIVWNLRAQPVPEGLSPLGIWNHTRPDFVESEAQQRAAFLASVAGASMYAVHVTNAQTLDVLHPPARPLSATSSWRRVRTTSPMTSTPSCGPMAKVNPPLRTAADREALWQAIARGRHQCHRLRPRPAPPLGQGATTSGRRAPASPGWRPCCPSCCPRAITGAASPWRVSSTRSTSTPARTFGLWPRKGAIAIGADADFALVDLDGRHTVRAAEQRSGAEYTIYEGWELTAAVEHTVVRGRFVLRDREVVAADGGGRFQPRHREWGRGAE